MSRVLQAYLGYLKSYPYTTTCIQTGIMSLCGDVIAQQLVERKTFRHHDVKRTLRLACIGLLFLGPILTTWYKVLDGLFIGTGGIAALQKTATDQICFAPCVIGMIFTLNEVLAGNGMVSIKQKLSCNYWDTLKTNYKVWPLVQIINFGLIPLQHRVMFVNAVAIVWNSYLSIQVNKETSTKESNNTDIV